MFNIKNLFKKKELPGVLGLLSTFGISIETILPQAESGLIDWVKTMQAKIGCPIVATASLDEASGQIILCVYKDLGENGLDLWQQLPFSEIQNLLQKLKTENATDVTPEPAAAIDYTAGATEQYQPTEPAGTEPAAGAADTTGASAEPGDTAGTIAVEQPAAATE